MLPSTRPGGREYMPWPFLVHRLESPTWFGFWRSRRETLCPIQDHPSEGGILSSAACSVYFHRSFHAVRTRLNSCSNPVGSTSPRRIKNHGNNTWSFLKYVQVGSTAASLYYCGVSAGARRRCATWLLSLLASRIELLQITTHRSVADALPPPPPLLLLARALETTLGVIEMDTGRTSPRPSCATFWESGYD